MIIHYFASIREQLNLDSEEINDSYATVDALIAHLGQRGDSWRALLTSEQTLVAVNQKMASRDTALDQSSEVAFFPFMTGG